jgi:hypothetical protein
MGGSHINRPIVGMGSAPSGDAYWLVASDGGIFYFGASAAYLRLRRQPQTEPAHHRHGGQGDWLFASDGRVFTYADAAYAGSAVETTPLMGGP